ncbi:MAG TPA: DUF4260 domain-containing protein [Kofleriaceae bacterium]|nr:DUF4260 domain-containing protein [Kofleriaceae bacterium]
MSHNVIGGPRIVLRLEAVAAAAAAVAAYTRLGGSWAMFAALFLVPDVSMLGYLVNPRVGAAAYNTAHTYVLGAVLAGTGLALGSHGLLLLAAISCAHVGFDRALGYGLKYGTAFGDTHLLVKRRAR